MMIVRMICRINSNHVEKAEIMIRIIVEGPPIAKKRPRFATRKTKAGKSFNMAYDVQTTESGRFLNDLKSQVWKEPLSGPLVMCAMFFMPMPKSMPKYKQALAAKGLLPHEKKPDLDNLIKFAKDCLNGIAYRDDSQVAFYGTPTGKRYDPRPRTEIRIYEFEEYFS